MSELKRWAWCTLEYKLEAVRLVKGAEAVTVTAKNSASPTRLLRTGCACMARVSFRAPVTSR